MKTSRLFLAVVLASCLTPNFAKAFSIKSVTFSPNDVVREGTALQMIVDIVTPSQGTWLYAPTVVSSNAGGIRVDIYPTSGMLTAVGAIRETVDLGTPAAGFYSYEVVIHPNYTVNWGTRTNRGTFIVQKEVLHGQLVLNEPVDGQQFAPGETIRLRATTANQAGPWHVEFLSDNQRIGTSTINQPFWWSEAGGGQHVITARATNPQGTTLLSGSAMIQVGPGPTVPVVSVVASPWRTGEPCPTCLVAPSFIYVQRTEPAHTSLRVSLQTDGTAAPGDDYHPLPLAVTIPPGERSVRLTLLPKDDQLAEGPEVVRVRVVPSPDYLNHYSDEALVVIQDDEQNAPTARLDIVAPTNAARFFPGETIELSALAVNLRNEVYGPVEFYAGSQFIARSPIIASARPAIPGLPGVHTAYWTNAPAGEHVLTARTELSFNQSITSPPVRIIIGSPELPVVRLETRPATNAQAREFCPPNADCAYPSFIVRRRGPTNAALSVSLNYSGTATPDVDYPRLPEMVVIPAGRESTFVMVVPRDDTLAEGPETVVARFAPVAGAPYLADPAFSSATITIIDNDVHEPGTVVSIEAVSRISEESSDPLARPNLTGVFRISRTGPISNSLPVFMTYSGLATSGDDYQPLPFLVTIPQGTNAAFLAVNPVVDRVAEGIETVVAHISNCPPPPIGIPCYDFAIDPAQGSATVFIRDDGLTEASVAINRPTNDASFNHGAPIRIEAVAIDLNGYISHVEFFDGNQRIGVSDVVFIQPPPPGTPIHHEFEWRGAAPGAHTLTARAARSSGSVITSEPVRITVADSGNQPPAIAITRPASGTEFPSDTAIEIVTEARDPDGYVRTAEFFANGRKLGERHLLVLPPPRGQTQTFTFLWREPTPGTQVITARAVDDDSGSALSPPVEIRVGSGVLPIVTVIATDCFAVEPSSNSILNTASFRLQRSGPTNSALTVRYGLRGAAQNGGDYEMLPGFVTIPAGSSSALLVIRPLADSLREGIENVVLQVEEHQDYVRGRSSRAVAVIADVALPLWSNGMRWTRLPDRGLHVCFNAQSGREFRVEASRNLHDWDTEFTTIAADGALHFVEDDTDALPHRFYRIAPEP